MVLVCSHHSHISPTLPQEEVGLKITLPATHSSVLTTLSLLQILNCITLIIHIACISVKVRQWVKCHLVLFASAFSYQTTSISHRPFPILTSYSIHAQIQRGFELGVVTPPPLLLENLNFLNLHCQLLKIGLGSPLANNQISLGAQLETFFVMSMLLKLFL